MSSKKPKREFVRSTVIPIRRVRSCRPLTYYSRPKTDPPFVVSSLCIRDHGIELADDSIVDLAVSDLMSNLHGPGEITLRQARFILENVGKLKTEKAREKLILHTIDAITEFGEPEGTEILQDMMKKFGNNSHIREAVSTAIGIIGYNTDVELLLSNLSIDLDSPKIHLDALLEFSQRYPEEKQTIAEFVKLNLPEETIFLKELESL